ncbi:MAG TPA: hypothetical protein VFL93_01505 [Longimicrobiaceae bacterium]|nr:hypothetical protein [Longimicrobiaceae bacterium]
MTENLVVIRTFPDLFDADMVQVDLLSAGIYSLLLTEEPPLAPAGPGRGVCLAVHQRDVERADSVMLGRPDAA